MPSDPIEYEWIRDALCVELSVTETHKTPTTDDDCHLKIVGRVGSPDDEDIEFAALPLIYALGALSFADARPRGYSGNEFVPLDDWKAQDMLRHLRFERGELRFYADYVRGRCIKTTIVMRRDGTFELDTVNRGEAASRWVSRLQGRKPLKLVFAADAHP
jgi:hypothetical protein